MNKVAMVSLMNRYERDCERFSQMMSVGSEAWWNSRGKFMVPSNMVILSSSGLVFSSHLEILSARL